MFINQCDGSLDHIFISTSITISTWHARNGCYVECEEYAKELFHRCKGNIPAVKLGCIRRKFSLFLGQIAVQMKGS
jgi:hypothetical protein